MSFQRESLACQPTISSQEKCLCNEMMVLDLNAVMLSSEHQEISNFNSQIYFASNARETCLMIQHLIQSREGFNCSRDEIESR